MSLTTGGRAWASDSIRRSPSHDNTDDEFSHVAFINAYLEAHGEKRVNLDKFRTLPSSQADGAQKNVGRLTNLMQLRVDTSFWTRYRSDALNPDLGDTLPQAVPTLAVGQHPAIPRDNSDLNDTNYLQAIANTASTGYSSHRPIRLRSWRRTRRNIQTTSPNRTGGHTQPNPPARPLTR